MIKDATKLLQIYREGGLRQLWEEKTQLLIDANPRVSPIRCGEIVAAILAHALGHEASELDSKVLPYTMTDEEAGLYDWLYVEQHACYRAELQELAGTRTMLADTPDVGYTPEWAIYISVPEGDDLL